MIGKTILHYKILEKLGEGGMGVVYKAEDIKLERIVALKFLPRHISLNSEESERFKKEAKAAAALNHPNIATIHAIEESEDQIFIVMEYIDGVELKDKIKSGPIPTDEAISNAIQIAEGLEAAHRKGIVHRDIKSQNIMITDDGKVKIMDFGLAKIKGGTELTKTGATFGTASYMSPEQTKGEEVDQRTDIWSFGVVLYEMLTGQLPFRGDYEQAVIYSIINEDPLPVQSYNFNCPFFMSELAEKCLNKNKEDRYNSFRSIINGLNSSEAAQKNNIISKELELTTNFILQKSEVCIGREKQLAVINILLTNARNGEGRTLFISGEPGIGKTQLVSSVIKQQNRSDLNVLYGRCLFNNEGGFPFHPFVNAIKNSISGDELQFLSKISQAASASGINISHRIPLIKNFLVLSDDRSNALLHKEQLWDAIFVLFKTIAANKTLILLLDDIQWADKASIGLFSFLARNIGDLPFILVGIHRPPEIITDYDTTSLIELIRQLNIEDLAENISLERLNQVETSEVIIKLFDNQSVDNEVINKVFRQSEGNPLFIGELVNLFRDKGLVEFKVNTWKLKKKNGSELVSKKVQDVIRQRIDYLDGQTKEILQVASCEGEYFQSDILSGILKINRLDLLKMLQSLEIENKIIRHEHKLYRFDHILMKEVIYDSIIPELREEYHQLIAQWLIENHGNKDEYASRISHHLIFAGREDQSLDYLLRAAIRARDLYAVEEALNNYNKLSDICKRRGISNENYIIPLEEGLGDVYVTLGRSEEARNHYKNYLNIAKARQDNFQLVRAFRKFAECDRIMGNIESAENFCIQALELAEKINNKNELLESLNTLAFINASKGEYSSTIEISDKTLGLANDLDDQKNKSISLSNLGFAYWHLGNYPLAMENFNIALDIQRSIGDNRGLSTTLNFLGLAYWKYEDAIISSQESVEIKNKIADFRKIPGSLNVIGDVYRDIGDIEKAISYHKQSLELARGHQNIGAMCDNIRDLGEDYFLNGDFDKALSFYSEVQHLATSSNIKWYQTRTYISLSELYLILGNLEEAKKNIKTGLEYSNEIGAKDLIIEALWTNAKIKAKENLLDESYKLFNEAIVIARAVGHQTFLWKLLDDYSNFLSIIGKNDEAETMLKDAKNIVKTIYDNIQSESLKKVYQSSDRVKKIIMIEN